MPWPWQVRRPNPISSAFTAPREQKSDLKQQALCSRADAPLTVRMELCSNGDVGLLLCPSGVQALRRSQSSRPRFQR